jgi:hypothetical protein
MLRTSRRVRCGVHQPTREINVRNSLSAMVILQFDFAQRVARASRVKMSLAQLILPLARSHDFPSFSVLLCPHTSFIVSRLGINFSSRFGAAAPISSRPRNCRSNSRLVLR